MLRFKTKNKETKENLLQNFQMDSDKRVNVKNIFSDIQKSVVIDPIDSKIVEKFPSLFTMRKIQSYDDKEKIFKILLNKCRIKL
jgi:hypothetical protein